MTGRVFATLLLGILISAALTQWLADVERQRVLERQRDLHPDRPRRAADHGDRDRAGLGAPRLPGRGQPSRPAARSGGVPCSQAAPAHASPKPCPSASARATEISSAAAAPGGLRNPPRMPLLYGLLSAEWRGACESLNVRLRDGEQLHLSVLPPRSLVAAETDYRAVLALLLVSIAFLAYLVARMTTRPLKQLAQAAQDLGNDINRAPLDLTGASEIRQASAAFNAMQARIRQYIFQRTQMLAAITHDLQTPLTRMRLRLEKVSDHELQERLIGDLSAMQAMVREGLDLARSMDTTESMQMLDLDSLLDSVCDDAADANQRSRCPAPLGHGAAGPSARPAPLPGQPDRQRRQVRPAGPGHGRPRQRRGADPHPRRRPRHSARRAGARVRSVLPRRDLALARIRRHRPGPDDRPQHRRAARRQHRAGQPSGRRPGSDPHAAGVLSRENDAM
jgi:signal transduction histidine kinase